MSCEKLIPNAKWTIAIIEIMKRFVVRVLFKSYFSTFFKLWFEGVLSNVLRLATK